MPLVGFLSAMPAERLAKISAIIPEGYTLKALTSTDEASRHALAAEVDYMITGGAFPIDAGLLKAGKKLKLVHKWGVGLDEFDTATAKELGIKIARTTGSNAVAVAEFAIALMLGYGRRIGHSHKGMQEGKWLKGELSHKTFMLWNRTIGIVGMGTIGKTIAERLSGFQSKIIYHNRRSVGPAEEARLNASYRSLPELLAESDIIVLACPLTDETRGLIGKAQFEQMKHSAVLINVARGDVVVEADLIEALQTGRIDGAGLDVFPIEPVPAGNPLLNMDNCLVTPHLAGAAGDNMPREIKQIFGNIQRVEAGQPVAEADSVV